MNKTTAQTNSPEAAALAMDTVGSDYPKDEKERSES